MRIKVMFAALFIVVLAPLAGCSGGQSGNQSSSQPSAKQSKQAASQKTAKPAQKKNPQPKTALGTISKVQIDKKRIYLLPTKGQRMRFRITKQEPQIIVKGKKGKLSDLQKGQQAKIEYRPGKNSGRIQNIQVFGPAPKGGGEKTGGKTTGG